MKKRDKIIEAAKASFSSFGYKGTTMDTVAKLAGIAKGTVYLSFKSKRELFGTILLELQQQMKQETQPLLEKDEPFSKKLPNVLGTILRFRNDQLVIKQIYHEAKTIGTFEAIAAVDRLEVAVTDFISKEVQKAIKNGEVRNCDPKIAASIMLRTYLLLAEDESRTTEQIIELFNLYVLEGIGSDKK